jgi:hypothetical protein
LALKIIKLACAAPSNTKVSFGSLRLPIPDKGYAKPERIFPLRQFGYDRFDRPAQLPGDLAGAQFILRAPLPRALFVGTLSTIMKERYGVLEHPDVKARVSSLMALDEVQS